jgi:hypothetical protein
VERVLNKHPAVRDAAVFGVPDAVLGERVASLVQLAENARPTARDEILASVKAALADYKVPEWLEFVSEIPRNGLGKIDRKLLRATVAFRGEAIATPNSSLHPRTGRYRRGETLMEGGIIPAADLAKLRHEAQSAGEQVWMTFSSAVA